MRMLPMMLRRGSWTSMRFKQKEAKRSKKEAKKKQKRSKKEAKKRLFLSLFPEEVNRFL